MAPTYPDSIVSFTERSLVNWNHAGRQNLIQDEIEAIQTELGALPKGSYDSVAARLTAVAPFPFLVVASDASDEMTIKAAYLADGTADDVQIQGAIDALPS